MADGVNGIDYDPVVAIAGRMKQGRLSAYLRGRAQQLQRFTEAAPYERLRLETKVTKRERVQIKKLNNERFRLNRQLAKTTDAKAQENLRKQVSDITEQIKSIKANAELKAQNHRSIRLLDDRMTAANGQLANLEMQVAFGANDGPTRDYLRTVIATRDTHINERVKAMREASWANLLGAKGGDGASTIPGFSNVSSGVENLGRMIMPTTTNIAANQIG